MKSLIDENDLLGEQPCQSRGWQTDLANEPWSETLNPKCSMDCVTSWCDRTEKPSMDTVLQRNAHAHAHALVHGHSNSRSHLILSSKH